MTAEYIASVEQEVSTPYTKHFCTVGCHMATGCLRPHLSTAACAPLRNVTVTHHRSTLYPGRLVLERKYIS